MMKSVLIWTWVILCNTCSSKVTTAFAPGYQHQPRFSSRTALHESILVISPEGGIGEVTAVEAAKLGASVKWFIVNPTQQSSAIRVSFNAATLATMAERGGSLQFASSDAASLLNLDPKSTSTNALEALCTWAGPMNGIVCTWDHPLFADKDEELAEENNLKDSNSQEKQDLIDAIKLAVQKVSSTNVVKQGMRVALLPSIAKMNLLDESDMNTRSEGPLAFFINNSNQDKVDVPSSMQNAISVAGTFPVATLRYGSLFGTPSSSVCSSNRIY